MKPNQNLDPLAALNNVTEEELSAIQEEEAAKPRKRKPREGVVFLISFYEAIELMPGRLQHKAYKVLTRYALYGEMPPKGTPTRIMQSFVGWKRLIDASSKKYDKAIGDRFAGKTDSKIKR